MKKFSNRTTRLLALREVWYWLLKYWFQNKNSQHTFALGVEKRRARCNVVQRQFIAGHSRPSFHFLIHSLNSEEFNFKLWSYKTFALHREGWELLTAFVLSMVAGCSNWTIFLHVIWLRIRTWHEHVKIYSLVCITVKTGAHIFNKLKTNTLYKTINTFSS